VPLPVPARAVLALLGGAAMGSGFPPGPVWLLVVAGVVAVLLACDGAEVKQGAWLGLLAGLAFFAILIDWLDVVGVDARFGLALVQAIYWVPMGAGLAIVLRHRWWPVGVVALWVGMEVIRSAWPFGGFPWGRLAFGVTESPYLGYAAVGGTAVVGAAVLLTACAGVALVRVVTLRRSRPGVVGAAATMVAGVAVVVLAPLAVPVATWDDSTEPVSTPGVPPQPGDDAVQVAVVQGNVPQRGIDFAGEPRQVLQNHVDATRALADQVAQGQAPQPDVVLWPENSSDIDPFTDEAAFAAIDGAVRAIAAPTLVGAVLETADPDTVENAGIVWDPVTGPGERYVKRHPVPFGEYIPYREVVAPLVDRLDQIPRDFAAGSKPGVLEVGPAVVGDVICFEVAYDPEVRDVVTGGADFITVQTNNATYALTGQPDQQFEISRLRAVEHARAVVVAATSGISGVIEADGSVQQRTDELVPATLSTWIEPTQARTLATTVGPWFGWTLVVLAVLWVLTCRRWERRTSVMPATGVTDRHDAAVDQAGRGE
jgi:apolipoprotein N-acyltransferase